MSNLNHRKIILFGAGRNGHMALSYYGSDMVCGFVDNDVQKAGSIYCGKNVMSVDEYKSIAKDYETIIAIKDFQTVSHQLEEAGIEQYSFYLPFYMDGIKKLQHYARENHDSVVVMGINHETLAVIKILQGESGADRIILADKSSSENIGSKYEQLDINDIHKINSDHVCYICGAPSRAYEIQCYMDREFPETEFFNPFCEKGYYITSDLVVNPYANETGELDENAYVEVNSTNRLVPIIYDYAEELYQKVPMFDHVEIETYNRCNGGCSFCPVSVKNETRPEQKMEESLFYIIIDQLSDLNYSGKLALFSNNEPFLDERILDFHKYARERLPHARMHLFSNGTLLTMDKFTEIIEYLDELVIDNYNQQLNLIENSRRIKEYCEMHPELKDKVTIVLRKPREVLTSRGGSAPNRKQQELFSNARCILPFKQVIIRPDGKLSLCCNDPLGKHTMGDLREQTLKEIWFGDKFEEARRALMSGRGNYSDCRYCDTFVLA